MRKVAYALPLGLLLAACSSTPAEEPAPEAPPPAIEESAPEAELQAAPGSPTESFLQEERQRLDLATQKQVFLIDKHLTSARDLKARLRLEEAEQEVLGALELDPDNLEAKQLLAEIGALMGKSVAEMKTVAEQLAERHALRVKGMRADAEDAYNRATVMLARNDFDAAIAELTVCLNSIRWAPYSIDWRGLDVEARQMLAGAKAARAAAARAELDSARREAYEELQAQEQAERDRRLAQVNNMVEQAIASFAMEEYEESMDFAERALKKDARNEKAAEIRDAAFRAGRQKVREDYIKAKNEQFKRWHEELNELTVPYTDVVTLPEEDYWTHISEIRQPRRPVDFTENIDPADLALRGELRSTAIPGLNIEEEESLEVVVDVIRTFTALPLVVDPAAENAAFDEGVIFTYNLQNRLTVEQALNIICMDAGEEVTWTVRHEAVLITTREKARSRPVIVNHDVQDLVFGLTDFLGPRIDRLRLLDELEDDDGGGPFGAVSEKITLIDMSTLTTMIQENVAVGTWEDEGVSIDEGEGYILVVHSPEVQAMVARFLDDLRRFSSSLVTIESKFMTVSSLYLQEIGVDFRGLDNPSSPFTDLDDLTNGLEDMSSRGLDNGGTGSGGAGGSGPPSAGWFYDDGGDGDFKGHTENFFGNALGGMLSNIGGITFQLTYLNDLQMSAILRAVEKRVDVQLINDQMLSVHNSQRAYVSIINQQAYIQDFDVEVAQFQAVADPQVNVLTEGVVLDVRPTIHHDRKYLTLEIQPTVANVVALRPFSTTLGGNTSPVEFQLPELEVQSVFTTAVIPDGGSILLGGLSSIRNIERRAEVPWVAKIPVVGFLFKQEGYNDENESLMILIRARITDVKDELARMEGTR